MSGFAAGCDWLFGSYSAFESLHRRFVCFVKDSEVFKDVTEKATGCFHFDFFEMNVMIFGFSIRAVFEGIRLEKFVHQFDLMPLAGIATVEADLGFEVFHFRPVLGQVAAPVIEQWTDDVDSLRMSQFRKDDLAKVSAVEKIAALTVETILVKP